MIVADTNLILYLLVRSQHTPEAELAYDLDAHWVAPDLWKSEFRSALALYVRKGHMELAEAAAHFRHAERLIGKAADPVDSVQVISLASGSGCSAYDCEFVALAQSLGVPLVTSDRKLAARFRSTAVHLRDFVRRPRP